MDPLSPALFANLGLPPLALIALLALALLFSAYVKIATALGILRFGLGAYSLPSAFVTGGLALALTVFVMYPTAMQSARALDRTLGAAGASASDLAKAQAVDAAMAEWKFFVRAQAHPDEQRRFSAIAQKVDARSRLARNLDSKGTESKDPVAAQPVSSEPEQLDSWRILAPAFVVSELKEAFSTGLALLLPFLIIDLLVANILTAIGLERLNPATVAVPCKLLLFIALDGWALIAGNLAATYGA